MTSRSASEHCPFTSTYTLEQGLYVFGVYFFEIQGCIFSAYCFSQKSVKFGACLLQHAEIRFLSGLCPSGITIFSVFFTHVRQIFEISYVFVSAKSLFGVFSIYRFQKYFVGGYFPVIISKYRKHTFLVIKY